jgi:signal transduction histidine kinase
VRKRLALLSLATTTLVVISFLIPLGLLVRREAADRARDAAEAQAQAAASLIALAITLEADPTSVASSVEPLAPGVIVVLGDGTVLGEPLAEQGTLVAEALESQSTISAVVPGGWELALPVVGRESIVVVDVFVTDAELTQGVVTAWLLLGVLGVALVGASVLLADRMGSRLVRPIESLAQAAHRMADGDLDTRVEIEDPPEIGEVAHAFNTLATRLQDLLVEERESVADLSHRLRTPLTALRLQAEQVADPTEREELVSQVDRLEQAIDRMIVDARRGVKQEPGDTDLDAVVGERLAFWKILAEEQSREVSSNLEAGNRIGIDSGSLETIVDILIGNVFAHTAPGTPFSVETTSTGADASLVVSDRGDGFTDKAMVKRGQSGAGSTGLGLDIVRRSAELTGGHLTIDDRPGGGAVVRVVFGVADQEKSVSISISS